MRASALRVGAFAATLLALSQLGVTQDTGSPKQPVVHEKKDANGRLVRRIVFNPDGTIHHMAVMFGPRASKTTVEVDLDLVREPYGEKRETLDEEGRLVERQEMSVVDGVKVRTRTKYSYDDAGRQTTKTDVVE